MCVVWLRSWSLWTCQHSLCGPQATDSCVGLPPLSPTLFVCSFVKIFSQKDVWLHHAAATPIYFCKSRHIFRVYATAAIFMGRSEPPSESEKWSLTALIMGWGDTFLITHNSLSHPGRERDGERGRERKREKKTEWERERRERYREKKQGVCWSFIYLSFCTLGSWIMHVLHCKGKCDEQADWENEVNI